MRLTKSEQVAKMSGFSRNIAPYVKAELEQSRVCEQAGHFAEAFTHLENAHVLGQASTYWHVLVHLRMLMWGVRHKDVKEIFGQLLRIVGAALLTWVMAVPKGNTGGSNVSAMKVMPIKPELKRIIEQVKKQN